MLRISSSLLAIASAAANPTRFVLWVRRLLLERPAGIAEVGSWGWGGAGRPPGRAGFLEPNLGGRQCLDAPQGEPPGPAAGNCLDVGAPVLAACLVRPAGDLPVVQHLGLAFIDSHADEIGVHN